MAIGSVSYNNQKNPMPPRPVSDSARPKVRVPEKDSAAASPARQSQTQTQDQSGIAAKPQQPAEQKKVTELEKIDAAVRAHELAHLSTGGRFVQGGARFQFQTGPDGKQYAVAGEVRIDSSPVPGDPEATIEKMDTIRAAALAPTSPSSQDMRVAAMASRYRAEALQEISLMRIKSKMGNFSEKQEVYPHTAEQSNTDTDGNIQIGSRVDLIL